MSDGLTGVVVSHGTVAKALVDAVHAITGDAGALAAISNQGCGRDSLRDLVAEAACDGDCVLFVDLPSGSFTSGLASSRATSCSIRNGHGAICSNTTIRLRLSA